MRFVLLSFVILSFFLGNTQSAFYSTENKKAIKFYEKEIRKNESFWKSVFTLIRMIVISALLNNNNRKR